MGTAPRARGLSLMSDQQPHSRRSLRKDRIRGCSWMSLSSQVFFGTKCQSVPRRHVSHMNTRSHPIRPQHSLIWEGLAHRSSPESTETPQQLSAAGPGTGKAPGPAHPAPNPPQLRAPRASRGLLPPPAGLLALFYGGRPPGCGGTQAGDVTARPVAGSSWISASGGGSKALSGSSVEFELPLLARAVLFVFRSGCGWLWGIAAPSSRAALCTVVLVGGGGMGGVRGMEPVELTSVLIYRPPWVPTCASPS